jgi:hypothetical protein
MNIYIHKLMFEFQIEDRVFLSSEKAMVSVDIKR